MTNKLVILLLIILLFLVSCVGSTGTNSVPVDTSTKRVVNTSAFTTADFNRTDTPVEKATSTIPYETPTSIVALKSSTTTVTAQPSLTNIPYVPLDAKLNVSCLEILDQLPHDYNLQGVLIMMAWGVETPSYLWNVESGEKQILSPYVVESNISPNREKYAFMDFEDNREDIKIINSNGEVIQTIPSIENWSSILRWIDNDTLVIGEVGEPLELDSIVVLDLKTREWTEYRSDYPEIWSLELFWEQYSTIAAVYDFDLKYVVYPALPPDNYILWDLRNQKEIMQVHSSTVVWNAPVWSPHGDRFAVALASRDISHEYIPDEDIYLVDLNGKVRRMSFINQYSPNVDISFLTWSPDERYIAFWVDLDPSSENLGYDAELAVLDLPNQEVTYYCIPGDAEMGNVAPIWSPDSQQILVYSLFDDGNRYSILVDISDNFAAKLILEDVALGWMRDEP